MHRTIQRMLLIAALGLVTTFGTVGTAHAGETEPPSEGGAGEEHGELEGIAEEDLIHAVEVIAEENGGDEFTAHCIEILVEGGEIDECQEAPNLLLPETNEIIWGGIGFIVVFLFLAKFGFPAIKSSMNDRTERIRSDLEEAETAKSEAQRVLDDYKAQLAGAKGEAGRIIEEARQQADQMRRDQENKLQADLADMRAKAQTDIEATKSQAMSDLRGDVADLALGAAEAVVEANLDRSTQLQLIENYINQVGQRS